MAGFSKIYCIGGLGGFQGADGINPIRLQIWVGDGDRQWLEARCFGKRIRPLGAVKAIVPEGPDHPSALLDACLAFYPEHFRECPSLEIVARQVNGMSRLDFHAGKKDIPNEWAQLRKEAWPQFRKLNVYVAELRPVKILEENETSLALAD